ncbi:hypothetical protein [Bailinhaonella thermotolerans]|uniref:Uncharacterized protein n=1 Tax=Bailinhaonella thermotolerans TaxID=1070861 RepID=A0A3A4B9Q7_9ACTN|nr:hypothetical protein [Bailinhaonella thermotolerans]RJL35293.1 hypothetical protein D5H75_00205 [Bailinhaonella thermotolerans]
MFGNADAAWEALRNWVINLNRELAGSGVYAACVVLNVWVGGGGPDGAPAAAPERIAPLCWEVCEYRDRAEVVFGA